MTGKSRWFLITASVTLSVLELQAGGPAVRELDGTIPPVLFTTLEKFDPSYPTFVAADAAFDQDGQINRTLFHPHVIDNILDILRDEPVVDGCHMLGEVHYEESDLATRFTLNKAIERSPLILTGHVVDQEYGFRGIQAGQLLAVKADEAIKGSTPLEIYYVFVPVGTFVTGPYRICKNDPGYAEPPVVGERVMVLVPRPVQDAAEPYLDIANAEGLIVIEEGGGVRLPDRLQKDEGAAGRRVTAESVVTLARRLSGQVEAP